MLCCTGDRIHIPYDILERMRFLDLLESERRFYVERHFHDEAGGTEATDGRHEKVAVLISRAADARAIRQEEDKRTDVHGDDRVGDARAVGRSSDDTAKCLVRDGTNVLHGEAMLGKDVMEGVEGDAGLGSDVVLLATDLGRRERCDEHGWRKRDGLRLRVPGASGQAKGGQWRGEGAAAVAARSQMTASPIARDPPGDLRMTRYRALAQGSEQTR